MPGKYPYLLDKVVHSFWFLFQILTNLAPQPIFRNYYYEIVEIALNFENMVLSE